MMVSPGLIAAFMSSFALSTVLVVRYLKKAAISAPNALISDILISGQAGIWPAISEVVSVVTRPVMDANTMLLIASLLVMFAIVYFFMMRKMITTSSRADSSNAAVRHPLPPSALSVILFLSTPI